MTTAFWCVLIVGLMPYVATSVAKSKRGFVLVPVHFHPPKPEDDAYDSFGTDEVVVYLQDGATGRRNLQPTTLPLTWHSPLAHKREARPTENTLEITSVQQENLFSGNVAVKYVVGTPSAKVRLLLFDSNNLKSIEWFATTELSCGP